MADGQQCCTKETWVNYSFWEAWHWEQGQFFIAECGPAILTQSAYNCVYLLFIYSLSTIYLLECEYAASK